MSLYINSCVVNIVSCIVLCVHIFLQVTFLFFLWGNLKERDHLGDPAPRWDDNIKMDV